MVDLLGLIAAPFVLAVGVMIGWIEYREWRNRKKRQIQEGLDKMDGKR